jgi:hypothetical protein
VRSGGLWAKHMGLKGGAIGNTLWETRWENWELEGNKGKKKKNQRHFECMLSLPIGCMKFLFPKLLVTIIGLD